MQNNRLSYTPPAPLDSSVPEDNYQNLPSAENTTSPLLSNAAQPTPNDVLRYSEALRRKFDRIPDANHGLLYDTPEEDYDDIINPCNVTGGSIQVRAATTGSGRTLDPFQGLVRGQDYQVCSAASCGQKIMEREDQRNSIECYSCLTPLCFVCGRRTARWNSTHWNVGNPCPRYGRQNAHNNRDHPNTPLRQLYRAPLPHNGYPSSSSSGSYHPRALVHNSSSSSTVAIPRSSPSSKSSRRREPELFACDQCNTVCKRRDSLDRHKQTQHQGIRFQCYYCNFVNSRRDHMKEHCREEHPNEQEHYKKI